MVILQGLKAIDELWNMTDLEIVPYKDKGHFKLV